LEQKVIIFTRKFHGIPGYDLIVRDDGATVQDYLNAFDAAIAHLPLARTRRRGVQECFGCGRCCAERAPLTLIDCLHLREAVGQGIGEGKKRKPGNKVGKGISGNAERREAGRKIGTGTGKRMGVETGRTTGAAGDREAGGGTGEEDPEGRRSWKAFFDRCTTVTVRGPVVDIVLKRDEDGRCIFLDRQTKLCRVYRARPFVCRTFICSPAARRALALREAVVNKGEDELVRLWFTAGMVIHQTDNPRPDPRDWPPTPFADKTRYSEVRLKDVLPGKVWRNVMLF